MSKTPINLNMKRAFASQDSRHVTPLELLEFLVQEIKAGRWKPEQMLIVMQSHDETGESWTIKLLCANMTQADLLAALARAQHATLEEG